MESCYEHVTNQVGWVLIICNPLLTELYKDAKKTPSIEDLTQSFETFF